jgi:hypothetical protein
MEYPLCPQSAMGIGDRDVPCIGSLVNRSLNAFMNERLIVVWECTECSYKTAGYWEMRQPSLRMLRRNSARKR